MTLHDDKKGESVNKGAPFGISQIEKKVIIRNSPTRESYGSAAAGGVVVSDTSSSSAGVAAPVPGSAGVDVPVPLSDPEVDNDDDVGGATFLLISSCSISPKTASPVISSADPSACTAVALHSHEWLKNDAIG